MPRSATTNNSGGSSATVHFAHPNVDCSQRLEGMPVRELCALLEQGQQDIRDVKFVEVYGLLVNATRIQVCGGAQASRLVLRDDDPQCRRFECTMTFFGNLPSEISRGSTARVIGNANFKEGFLAFHVSKCSGPLERSYAKGFERTLPYDEA